MMGARDTLKNTDFRITDDLTAKDLEEKRRLVPLMNKLYHEKQRPRFVMAASMPMANQFPARISTHIWPNLQMLLKMDRPRRNSPFTWYTISSLQVNKKYEWYKCRWYRWPISWHSSLYHSFKVIHLFCVCQLTDLLINRMCVTWRTITVRISKGLNHPKLTKIPFYIVKFVNSLSQIQLLMFVLRVQIAQVYDLHVRW